MNEDTFGRAELAAIIEKAVGTIRSALTSQLPDARVKTLTRLGLLSSDTSQ